MRDEQSMERIRRAIATVPWERLADALTHTQLAILRALCNKTQLWDPKNGNASLAFKRVQLPIERLQLLGLTGDYKRPGLLDRFRRE